MRRLINITESLFDSALPPADTPLETSEFQGLIFKMQENRYFVNGKVHYEDFYYVWKDDTVIGGFSVEEREDSVSIHPELYEPFQRKGYGTIIYNFAEILAKEMNKPLIPSDIQSTAAVNIWKKR